MHRFRLLFPTLVSGLLLAAPVHAAFTLEQIMSAPFASNLTASASGNQVAWVLYEQGKRNIYLADAPDWKSRKATEFNDDDGQEIDELAWARDNSALYFVRGGDFEMGRENPNPALNPARPDQSIWLLPLNAAPKKLTEGHSPETCQGDAALYFIKGGKIWSTVKGSDAKELVHTSGSAGDLTCSPDGKQLAFREERKQHSIIGIYSLIAKKLSYPDPSVDDDQSPVWSPDGNRLAYIRVVSDTRPFAFGPVRESQPFSIRVIDCAVGRGKELWRADPGRGSAFSEIVAEKQLFWTRDGEIVFPWEKTGWKRLYAMPESGGAPRLLTAAEAEVEHVSLAMDGETILYSTNANDIDRRHIWQVRAKNEVPQQLTRGAGIEWSPVSVSGGSVAVLASNARHSSNAASLNSGKLKELAPQTTPRAFPGSQLVEPQQVIISGADGMRLHAQLFLPPGSASTNKHPALVFFHGGSRRQMLLGFHYMRYYSNAYELNQYLASKGYIVLSVNYRSGIGYGMEFREALNYGATGASEFNDVLGAGLYLRSRTEVDSSRIGLWGGSYGGYLTALGLARASDLFQAGVDFHGVHDWNDVIENFAPAYDPRVQQDAARLAFASSPLSSMDTWRSPVLLIHGDDDRNVPFTQTTKLVEALRKRNLSFELIVLPNEVHDFLRQESWVKAYTATADFFDRKLRRQ